MEARLIEETNALLRLTGFGDRTFKSTPELVASVSSMSVALYEKLFDLRLDGVVREPHSLDDYSENAQLVIDALAAAMLTDELRDVSGTKICAGDLVAIRDLVRVLTHVYQMLRRSQRDAASSDSDRNSLSATYYTKRPKKGAKRTKKPVVEDPSLLTTKKYGRFVPAASAASSKQSSRRASSASSNSERSIIKRRDTSAPRVPDFGSVSSVSFAGTANGALEDTSAFSFPEDSDVDETPVPAPMPIERAKPPVAPKADDCRPPSTSPESRSEPSKLRLEDMLPDASRRSSKSFRPLPNLKSTERMHQARYKAVLSDHVHSMRRKEQQQHARLGRAVQQQQHALQVERIRAAKIHQELRRQRVALGLDQKRLEERHLKETMDTLLHLERDRLRQEAEATATALQTIEREHARKEQALETFYAHQMDLAKEQRERELQDRALLEQAHRLASEKLLRETRQQREKELQDVLAQRRHLAQVQHVRQERRVQAYVAATQRRVPVMTLDVAEKVRDPFRAAALKSRTAKGTYSQSAAVRRIYGAK
ncbi:hypothetical protein ACHHYP_20184 [Achlya hypogyna]|uniref:DUF5745 domain-containing protein n=1 Tax=Achlya hypogyna TaxID=1202772 RepID=A0A1V9Z0Q2_ACHHY|nr:hypothetical protein ACHHYP_20184 [Achlya hypogyna]